MQLSLSNSITTPEYCESAYATKYASFNGTNSKAVTNSLNRLPDLLASSTGTIGDNVTIAMWVKATWEIPDSPADADPNVIPIFMLGSGNDVHESFRCYYFIEDSSANNKNDLVIEIRSSTPSNARNIEFMRLHSNSSLTGSTSSAHTQMWRAGNSNINTNADGFVHIAFTRGTGDWKVFWNGQSAGTLIDSDSGTLASTSGDYDSFSLGYWEYSDFFGKLGMRDFAIYNTQLADSKIETLYNSGVMADYSTLLSDDPTVYYPLQEDGNNVAFGSLPINFTLSNVTFDNI